MNINRLLSDYSANQLAATASTNRTAPPLTTHTETKNNGSFSEALANAKSLGSQLEDYLAMSDAERYQLAWLKKNGMTKESFDALPAEEKLKLAEKMQQEMKEEMQAKMEAAKEKNTLALNIFA